jgi:hypothetical protein
MRLMSRQDGSIPMALLASIVTGGLIIVLVGTVIQSERTVRFDRAFTNVIQAADMGVETARHRLNNRNDYPDVQLAIGEHAGPFTTDERNGMSAEWEIERLSVHEYEVVSTGTAPDGTQRTVEVQIDEDSLFFPGAVGDRLVALNGQSTSLDSYESRSPVGSCSGNTNPDLCWGTHAKFGTRKGALGTNETFDFSGVQANSVNRAVLYDWLENPGNNVSDTNPGGDRCTGHPCTPEVLRFERDPLDYASDERMSFIRQKLGDCAGRELDAQLGDRRTTETLTPQSTAAADNQGTPADPAWKNYYCADSLQILGDIVLDGADADTPVVIFVRDSVSISGHVRVNCPDCPSNLNSTSAWRSVRPISPALQIYVATEEGQRGADVQIAQHAAFAGVIYAPRASCGASGNAGAHVYGSLICRRIDNVGNWHFHYDERLADFGRNTFSVVGWREEPPVS